MNSCCTYYIASSITAVNDARGTSSGLASLASDGSFFCSVGCVICTYLLFSDNKS